MEPGNAYNHLCGPTETPEGYHNVDVAGHLRSAPDLDPTAAFTRADFGRFWPSTSFTALQKCGRYRINSGQTAPSGLTGSAAFASHLRHRLCIAAVGTSMIFMRLPGAILVSIATIRRAVMGTRSSVGVAVRLRCRVCPQDAKQTRYTSTACTAEKSFVRFGDPKIGGSVSPGGCQ